MTRAALIAIPFDPILMAALIQNTVTRVGHCLPHVLNRLSLLVIVSPPFPFSSTIFLFTDIFLRSNFDEPMHVKLQSAHRSFI